MFHNRFFSRKQSPLKSPLIRSLLIGIGIVCGIGIAAMSVPALRNSITPLYTSMFRTYFYSQRQLRSRIVELQTTIAAHDAERALLHSLQAENALLKEGMGRIDTHSGVLAHVLTTPERSMYDTFIIDAGSDDGIVVGQQVVAFNAIALGTVSAVTEHRAVVSLYSTPDNQIVGTAENGIQVALIGRGGGEYEVHMPRSVPFAIGGTINAQSTQPLVLAEIKKIDTDPRDPFQRLIAKAPLNFTYLKWVMVQSE